MLRKMILQRTRLSLVDRRLKLRVHRHPWLNNKTNKRKFNHVIMINLAYNDIRWEIRGIRISLLVGETEITLASIFKSSLRITLTLKAENVSSLNQRHKKLLKTPLKKSRTKIKKLSLKIKRKRLCLPIVSSIPCLTRLL